MKDFIKLFIVLISIFAVILTILSYVSRKTYYQFTTYKVMSHGQERNITWATKIDSRAGCSDLMIYKRHIYPDWLVIDSFCVAGSDQVGQFIDANYDEWLRTKFQKKILAQTYAYFKDSAKNESLIYFSDSDGLLDEIATRLYGKMSGWMVIQPHKP